MLAKAQKIWDIISLIIPFLRAIRNIVEWVEELADEVGGEDGEKKKELAMKVVMEIYDLVDDVLDDEKESLPIKRETFEKHANRLIDIVVYILNVLNIFNGPGEEQNEDEEKETEE